jgi:predicted nucleotidyltransferase
MSSSPIIEQIRALKPALARDMKIRRIRVFGSVARHEETAESDVDLLVDFSETPGLFRFIGMQRELSTILGRKVDLVTTEALHPLLKEGILNEAIDV